MGYPHTNLRSLYTGKKGEGVKGVNECVKLGDLVILS